MKKMFSCVFLALIFGLALVGCSTTPKSYEISVYINGANFGRVSDDINGTYQEGQSVTISATPYENQTFFCWLHDNKVVSIDPTYTFDINEESSGSYIALFVCPDLEYIYLNNFSFTNGVDLGEQEEIITTLNSFSLSFGYTQNDLIEVYNKTDFSEEFDITEDSTVLYEENKLPFTFDKTKSVYVKIGIVYERAGIKYESNTTYILPAKNVGEEHSNLTDKDLNQAICVSNPDIPALEQSTPSKISINFNSLSTFEFTLDEPEESME